MKVVFMGTPDFAAPALENIIKAGHEVILAVTQPDRAKGRSKELIACPVKEMALKYNIPVFQPEKIKQPEAVEELKKYAADIFVVAAFGQILSKEILDMPKYGCVNIHASLLPKYRGAAPIQWAVIDGEEETGVTIMKMDVGLDTGDILIQEKIKLDKKETGESLFDRLSELGSDLIVKALPLIEAGKLTPVKQDEEKSTYAKMLTKELGNIDFSRSANEIERLVRGLNSWPSAYTKFNGKVLKIWGCDVLNDDELKKLLNSAEVSSKPGTIVHADKTHFVVKCGEGAIIPTEVQLEGKKRITCGDFMNAQNCEALIETVLGE